MSVRVCVATVTIEEVVNLKGVEEGMGRVAGAEMGWGLCKYSTYVRNF